MKRIREIVVGLVLGEETTVFIAPGDKVLSFLPDSEGTSSGRLIVLSDATYAADTERVELITVMADMLFLCEGSVRYLACCGEFSHVLLREK